MVGLEGILIQPEKQGTFSQENRSFLKEHIYCFSADNNLHVQTHFLQFRVTGISLETELRITIKLLQTRNIF